MQDIIETKPKRTEPNRNELSWNCESWRRLLSGWEQDGAAVNCQQASILRRKVTLMSKSSAHVWTVQLESSNPLRCPLGPSTSNYLLGSPSLSRSFSLSGCLWSCARLACWSINKPRHRPHSPFPCTFPVLIAKLCNHDVWYTHHTHTHTRTRVRTYTQSTHRAGSECGSCPRCSLVLWHLCKSPRRFLRETFTWQQPLCLPLSRSLTLPLAPF